jgi:hypothetical protein
MLKFSAVRAYFRGYSRVLLPRAGTVVAVVLLGTMASTAQTAAELIIQVRPGVSEQDVKQLSQRVGAEYMYALGGPAHLVRVPDMQRAASVLETLRAQPDIVSAEPNQPVKIPE